MSNRLIRMEPDHRTLNGPTDWSLMMTGCGPGRGCGDFPLRPLLQHGTVLLCWLKESHPTKKIKYFTLTFISATLKMIPCPCTLKLRVFYTVKQLSIHNTANASHV